MVAYVAVTTSTGFALAAASSERRGYVPVTDGYPTLDAAEEAAEALNDAAGVCRADALAVKMCSMFRPGAYAEVRPLFGCPQP